MPCQKMFTCCLIWAKTHCAKNSQTRWHNHSALYCLKKSLELFTFYLLKVSHSQQSGLTYVNICWSVAEHEAAGEDVIVRWHQSFWPYHVCHFGTEPAVPLLCWHEHSNVGFLEQPSRLGPSGLKPPKLRLQRPTYLSLPWQTAAIYP